MCPEFFVPSDASRKAFKSWKEHDDAQYNFCELDGELS